MHATRGSSTAKTPGEIRKGAIILEFLIVYPIVVIALLAIFEFGILLMVHQAATTAAIEGARVGSLQPLSSSPDFNNGVITDPNEDNDVADKIALYAEQFLAVHRLEFETGGNAALPDARIYIQRNIGGTVEMTSRGNTNINCTPPAIGDDQIQVTICFQVVNGAPSSHPNPVPNWLAPFGFSLSNRTFQVTANAALE